MAVGGGRRPQGYMVCALRWMCGWRVSCWYISRRDLVLVGGVLDDEEVVKGCGGWDDDEAWLLGEEDVARCEGDKGGERW